MRVDLCWFGSAQAPAWNSGEVFHIEQTVTSVAAAMRDQAVRTDDGAVLFWDASLGTALDPAALSLRRADVVHAGLALGTSGAPASLDFVAGSWMWNVDPPPEIEATSWRVSLRACWMRIEVLRQLGGIHEGFESLDCAALEAGHRWLTRGAFVRHDGTLVACPTSPPLALSLHDELLFVRLRYSPFWARWAMGRGLATGVYAPRDIPNAIRALAGPGQATVTFQRNVPLVAAPANATVSVIMPTIERYPYLRVALKQLAVQTVPVHEIIIVDQTPEASREINFAAEFPDLPIKFVYQPIPGQCSARNQALRLATGEYALFIDDDDEVDPDLIERHLLTMATYGVDVSSGVAPTVGEGPVPEYHRFLRASDIFPTNNTMIRRSVLRKSGMFDLAYDCKMVEDADLGMRLYLAGVMLLLDPSISVLHHHAPRGGLRQHGARAITYASSRQKITHRSLPHVAEVYLSLRYYTARQVAENLVLRTWGTLRSKGGRLHQSLKAAYAVTKLLDTRQKVRSAEHAARELLSTFPQIEPLP